MSNQLFTKRKAAFSNNPLERECSSMKGGHIEQQVLSLKDYASYKVAKSIDLPM